MAKKLGTLAVGDTIEIPVKTAYQSFLGEYIVFKIADKNHEGYPANSVTLITDKIIALLCSDAKEPKNSNEKQKFGGNNRHIYSNILQWLNSNATAGSWYRAKHKNDAIPERSNVWAALDHENNFVYVNPYSGWAGFLLMFNNEFVTALMDTTLTVAKNTVTDGGGSDTFISKMFLASTTEVGLANENNIAEGSKLSLFNDDISRPAYCTQESINKSNYWNDPTTSTAWDWWLRTPKTNSPDDTREVNNSGKLVSTSACVGYEGVRPLCNLLSSILVSDTTNARGSYEFYWNPPTTPNGISVPESCYSEQNITVTWGTSTDPDGDAITYILERSVNDGAFAQVTATTACSFSELVLTDWNTVTYRVKAKDSVESESEYITSNPSTVIHNQSPSISGQDTDLGVMATGLTYDYTVNDPEGDPVTVVEKVDGNTLRTLTPTLGAQNTLTLGKNAFATLTRGAHTITITATDTAQNEVVRTLTLTKTVNAFEITLANPLTSQTQPKRANVTVTRSIPAGATFKVEATNNPYDESVLWEDCTRAVIQGVAHVFKNKINTANQHGMNIRATVERGQAISECWVSSIEGNFE